MANPVVAVSLYAETRGFLSFATFDGSRKWFVGAHLRLKAAANAMAAEALKVEPTLRERYTDYLRMQDRGGTADDLDLAATWYIMYRPELLRELGVDFGTAKPVSG